MANIVYRGASNTGENSQTTLKGLPLLNTEIDGNFRGLDNELATKAPLASPALTGTPTAPTAAAGTNTTQVATTAFVNAERSNTATLTNKTLTSPALDGTPTAPTAAAGTNTTQVATTAFVNAERTNTATLTNKTLTNPTINAGSGTIVLPGATTPAQTAEGSVVWDTDNDLLTVGTGTARKTIVDTDSTQTLTNKTVNNLTITAPATSATLTIANGKTLTANNSVTLTGTDASTLTFGTGGTIAYQGGKLSQFAATTSAELAGVISDETGSGALVFATQPTFVTDIKTPIVYGSVAASGTLTLASTTNATKGEVIVGGSGDVVKLNTTTAGLVRTNSTGVFSIDTTSYYYDGGVDVKVADGGTGLSTVPTSGQLLIGNGTGYTLSTLTAGTGVSVSNSAGAITIANTDRGSSQNIFKRMSDGLTTAAADSNDDVFTFSQAGGLTVVVDATGDSVTYSHADTSTQASVNNSNGTVIQDITLDTYGHLTALASVDLDQRFLLKSGDTVSGNLTVTGTLTVNGTTTTINAETVDVTDKNIVLGNVATPTDITADGGGITLRGTTNKTFSWLDVSDSWNSSEHLTLAAGKSLYLTGATSGTASIVVPAAAGTPVLTLPTTTGTFALTSNILNGTFAVSAANDGATNTSVTWGTSTGFSANSSTNTTYNLRVGPALSNLSSTMTGATTGFLKKTAQDTYTLDTNTYLTSQSSDFGKITVSDTDTGYTWAATGTATADAIQDTLSVISGVGIDVDVSIDSDAIRISHTDTSSAANLSATARTYVTGLTFDTFGHVTGYSTGSESVIDTNTTYSISAADGADIYSEKIRLTDSSAGTDDVTLAVGAVDTVYGLTIERNVDTITLSHANTSAQASVDNSGVTYIQDITLDTYGHITAIGSGTVPTSTSSVLGLIKLGSDTAQTTAANAVTTTASRSYAVQANASSQLLVNVPWTDTTYSTATSSVLGLVKLGSDTAQATAANAVTSTVSRTYAVQLNASGQMMVNVPWTDTTYSSATSSVLGLVKLGSDTAQTIAANTVTATASRSYAVQANASGQLLVNVPWVDTDTNTTYTLDGSGTTNNVNIELVAGGSGSGTDTINLIGSGATTVAWDEANQRITVSSTDNNTTYSISAVDGADAFSEKIRLTDSSAGTDDVTLAVGAVDTVYGLTIARTGDVITLSHANTSSQASVDNSANTFIQDISLDTYGHITGITSGTVSIGDGTLTLATSGSGISGSQTFTANQSTAATFTVTSNATAANTASTIVFRDATGSFTASTINATDFNSTSDARLKENISGMDGLSLINNLIPVSFEWKNSGKKSYGLIAQEVEAILPELVNEREDGMKGVSYIPIIAMLVDTVKKLDARIKELETK